MNGLRYPELSSGEHLSNLPGQSSASELSEDISTPLSLVPASRTSDLSIDVLFSIALASNVKVSVVLTWLGSAEAPAGVLRMLRRIVRMQERQTAFHNKTYPFDDPDNIVERGKALRSLIGAQ